MIDIKGQKLTRCMPSKNKPKPFHHNQGSSLPKDHNQSSSHFKEIPKDHNQGSSFPSANPSNFKQIPKDHNQGSSPPSLKHPQWTKKKQAAQLCLIPHLVCNIMVKLKVCLFIPCFYVSLNSKIHVAFDVLCLCIYLKKKILKQIQKKKKIKIPKSSKKKKKKKNQMRKCLD